MSKNKNLHPDKWTINQLLAYCAQFNITVKPNASKEELVKLVLADEIDKE